MSNFDNDFSELKKNKPNLVGLEKRVKKLEVKSWFEIFITPVTLILISTGVSLYLGHVERKSSEKIASATIESAEKMAHATLQTQSLDIFFEYIANSQNPSQQTLAIETLRTVDPNLAERLAKEVKGIEGIEPSVINAAESVQQEAESRLQAAKIIAKMTRDKMRLRPNILSPEQRAAANQGEAVAETLCELPLGHQVTILEQGDGWTRIETICPAQTESVTGYIVDFAGNPPFEQIQ